MIDYSNPCSVGPLYCAVGFRADSDVESVSSGSLKNGNQRGQAEYDASLDTNSIDSNSVVAPSNNSRRLRKRIDDFARRGWLSQQEHRKYMALLSTGPTNPMTDHVLKELDKELNLLQDKFSADNRANKNSEKKQSSGLSDLLTPATSCLPTPMAERPHGLGVFPGPQTVQDILLCSPCSNPKHQESDDTKKLSTKRAIVEPSDMQNGLSQTQLSELFVEMCFFARLGFIQPPCCLRCTYRESMKEGVPNLHCTRWVVWRKNANKLLHPNELEGNILVVQCYAARQLLAGKLVENWRWDKTSRQLVRPRQLLKKYGE